MLLLLTGDYTICYYYLGRMLYMLLLYHAALGVTEPEVRHRLLLAKVPATTVNDLQGGLGVRA